MNKTPATLPGSARTEAFIGGRFVPAQSGATFECRSPIDGRVLCAVSSCGAADVDLAVTTARRAFDSGVWRNQPPSKRKRVLLALARLLMEKRDELALLETLDMGKPIRFSRALDVPASVNAVQWFAELIDKVYDEIAPVGSGALAMVRREPLGVVAAIVPWNFPLLTAVTKIAPALAAGNSVILKPSEKSPLTALRLAELAAEAGLPDGVLSVLPGFGETVGQAIGLHPEIDYLTFTGSTAVGQILSGYAARSNMKSLTLELGGKSPNIIFADAPDLDAAAMAATNGVFFNQGEVCTAGSRLLVQEEIREAFVEKVAAIAARMQPSNPLDTSSVAGAVVDAGHMRAILSAIQTAGQEGANLRLGGNQVMAETGGFYVEPTIFDNVTVDMEVAQKEIFGPVLSVIGFTDEADALRKANSTVYGLASAVWTNDIGKAFRMADGIKAGTVWVNTYDAVDMSVPFGGSKAASGQGRDRSIHAFDKCTQLKTVWVKYG